MATELPIKRSKIDDFIDSLNYIDSKLKFSIKK